MDDELELGIPDDAAAGAPRQRFRLLTRSAGLLARLLPAGAAAAWLALVGRLVAQDLSAEDAPPRPAEADTSAEGADPAQGRHGAVEAPRGAPAQVVPLHGYRVWRNPASDPGAARDFGFDPAESALDYPPLPARHARASAVQSDIGALPAARPRQGARRPDAGAAGPQAPGLSGRRSGDEAMVLATMAALAEGTRADAAADPQTDAPTGTGQPATGQPGAPAAPAAPDEEDAAGAPGSPGGDAPAGPAPEPVDHIGRAIAGTGLSDTLAGTPRDDLIDGGPGHDLIHARDGNDTVDGGDGDDAILGGDGNDVIYGGRGDDLIFGGGGDDDLFGGVGNDTILCGTGDDHAEGGDGDDAIDGGDGDDILLGGEGCDILAGGAGDDVLLGGAGDDRIEAGDGADVVDGGAGDDVVVVTVLDAGADRISGGAGTDTLNLSQLSLSVVVDLAAGCLSAEEATDGLVTAIENVIAGAGDDCIVANAEVNELSGGAGDDLFVFQSLGALQNGGAGSDVITDFQPGDKIDLSAISEQMHDYAAVKLFFAGYGADGGAELGAVFFSYDENDEDGDGGHTFLSGHVSLSEAEDHESFTISLTGHQTVTAESLIFEFTGILASI